MRIFYAGGVAARNSYLTSQFRNAKFLLDFNGHRGWLFNRKSFSIVDRCCPLASGRPPIRRPRKLHFLPFPQPEGACLGSGYVIPRFFDANHRSRRSVHDLFWRASRILDKIHDELVDPIPGSIRRGSFHERALKPIRVGPASRGTSSPHARAILEVFQSP